MRSAAVHRKATQRLIASSLVAAGCLFGSAGTVRWWNGWVFMAVGLLLVTALTNSLFRQSPELLEERMTAAKKAKPWDRWLVPLLGGILPLACVVVAGLDRRYGWTNTITTLESLMALSVMLGGMALTFWAMQSNPFFSSHVRIQGERGHSVVSRGPYRYVRHPGYSGSILYNLAVPVLLASLVALWVGIAIVLVIVVRTALEDRTLRQELAGYREYTETVRYRLFPGLW